MYCGGGGKVDFRHLTDSRYDASTWFSCEGSDIWKYTVELYPGTYEVTVTEGSYLDSNLPPWPTVVVDRLQVP